MASMYYCEHKEGNNDQPQNMGLSRCWAEKWLYGISINWVSLVFSYWWQHCAEYSSGTAWLSSLGPENALLENTWVWLWWCRLLPCMSTRRMLSANSPCPSTSFESHGILLSLLIKQTQSFSTLFILFLAEKFWNHESTAFLKYETKSMNLSSPTEGFSKWSSLPKGLCHTYQPDVDAACAIKHLKWHYMIMMVGSIPNSLFLREKHVFKTVF